MGLDGIVTRKIQVVLVCQKMMLEKESLKVLVTGNSTPFTEIN